MSDEKKEEKQEAFPFLKSVAQQLTMARDTVLEISPRNMENQDDCDHLSIIRDRLFAIDLYVSYLQKYMQNEYPNIRK